MFTLPKILKKYEGGGRGGDDENEWSGAASEFFQSLPEKFKNL